MSYPTDRGQPAKLPEPPKTHPPATVTPVTPIRVLALRIRNHGASVAA